MRVLLAVVILAAMGSANALTPAQWRALDQARAAGRVVGLPETMQALVLQESSLCRPDELVGDDGESFGCAQVSLAAAQVVRPGFTNLHELTYNHTLNMSIGADYLQLCMQIFRSWRRGLVCYNAGFTTAGELSDEAISRFPYVIKITERIEEVRRLRQVQRQRRSRG